MKVYLDVNVIVDYITSGERFGTQAAEVITLAKQSAFEAVTDPNTFVIAFFRMNKIIRNPTRCKKILTEVRKIIGCVNMDGATLDLALKRGKPRDLEDSVQIEAALKCKADIFLTNDKKLLKIKAINALTTEQFLKIRPYAR